MASKRDTNAQPLSTSAPSRRLFLRSSAAVPALVTALPLGATAMSPAAPSPAPSASGYHFLLPHEVEQLEPLLARLIPADSLGPGAKEAQVARFIDGQLAGSYGQMARSYRNGPWPPGTPQQGYQSAMTPAELIRDGLQQLSASQKPPAEMTATELDTLLRALEAGQQAPGKLFFEQLWQLTQEGFFADPVHGGNAGMVGWRLVGYPGAAAAYLGVIGQHGQPYRMKPVSLLDLQSGAAENDGIGHAIHQPEAAP